MFKTEQEKFWAENFGNEYIERNQGAQLLASNLSFFSKALAQAGQIKSCLEFGANIGMNLRALKLLYPSIQLQGIEINKQAAEELSKILGAENIFNGSIFDTNTLVKVLYLCNSDFILVKKKEDCDCKDEKY